MKVSISNGPFGSFAYTSLAHRSKRVFLTDGFQSGIDAAANSIAQNQKMLFGKECHVTVHQMSWSDQSQIENLLSQVQNLSLILAADCLYPDVSNWPSFFYTLSKLLNHSPSNKTVPKALIAFHKRNSFQTFEPFLDFWKLKSRIIPLDCLGLDKLDDVGGTKLPGPNTGSIILYEISV